MKMREEFRVSNYNIVTNVPKKRTAEKAAVVFAIFAIALFGGIILTEGMDNMNLLVGLVGLCTFLFYAVAIACAAGTKGSYDADESSVTLCCGRNTMRIDYRDITGMNWGIKSCNDGRGGVYYEERLVIAAEYGTYFIDTRIDMDYQQIAMDPSCFQQQVYDAKSCRGLKSISPII